MHSSVTFPDLSEADEAIVQSLLRAHQMELRDAGGGLLRIVSTAPAAQPAVPQGGAVRLSALRDDTRYRDTFLREFDSLTPENGLKMAALQPRRGRFDFAAADDLVGFARRHGKAVHGHALGGAGGVEAVAIGGFDSVPGRRAPWRGARQARIYNCRARESASAASRAPLSSFPFSTALSRLFVIAALPFSAN